MPGRHQNTVEGDAVWTAKLHGCSNTCGASSVCAFYKLPSHCTTEGHLMHAMAASGSLLAVMCLSLCLADNTPCVQLGEARAEAMSLTTRQEHTCMNVI